MYLQYKFTFDKAHTGVDNGMNGRFRHYTIYIYIWQGTPEKALAKMKFHFFFNWQGTPVQALAKIKFQVQRLGDLFLIILSTLCVLFV